MFFKKPLTSVPMSATIPFSKTLYGIGSFLLLFLFSMFAIGNVGFLMGFPIHQVYFYVAILSAAFILFFLDKKSDRSLRWVLIVAGLAIVLVFLCLYLSSLYFDCSFDGQWYHQDAILFLDRGWNPFYDSLLKNADVSGLNANYVNHYPKASWMVSAILFKLTHNVEMGKAIHFIALFAWVFMAIPLLRRWYYIPWLQSVLVVMMLALSPVISGQWYSFYVDGLVGSFLFLFFLLLIQLVSSPSEKKQWVLVGACFLLLIHMKFTALVYAALFVLGVLVFVLLRKRSLLKSYVLGWALLTFVGVFCFGYPTYVRNYVEKGHPFYPLMGKNNEGKSISEVQYAGNFFAMNRFEKFYAAHSALPMYTDHTHNAIHKPLFNLYHSRESWDYYRNHQPVAMSPFGPYGAELWLLFLALVLLFFWKNKNPWSIGAFFLVITTMVVQPEFWNFRYAPQIMLLFGLVCAELFSRKSGLVRGFTFLFALLFIFNETIVVYKNWQWVQEKNELLGKNLQALSTKKVKIHRGWMQSFELKLKAYHIEPNYQLESRDSLVKFAGDDCTDWQYVIPRQK
jgi:hypothetical protein